MSHKVLFAGDLHKRAKDITTIKGYVECNIAVQNQLINTIKDLNIDSFVSLGDWYDKGYASDVSASLTDYDLDLRLRAVLNGNFYGVIGNHIRLGMDSNPELHLIQPHPVLKSRRTISRKEQIMQTPNYIRINDVQISLMHYNLAEENALSYIAERQDWCKFHIAIYHTDKIIPNSQLVNTNYGYIASSNSDISTALKGVDLAIVGHIHNALGKFTVQTTSGPVTMIVPGSMTNVDAGENSRHAVINMPLVTISDDSTVTLEFVPFDLKTNLVSFEKKSVALKKDSLKTLRGNSRENLYNDTESMNGQAIIDSSNKFMSLNAFMLNNGYTQKDKQLVRSVLSDPCNLNSLVNVYSRDESV